MGKDNFLRIIIVYLFFYITDFYNRPWKLLNFTMIIYKKLVVMSIIL